MSCEEGRADHVSVVDREGRVPHRQQYSSYEERRMWSIVRPNLAPSNSPSSQGFGPLS